MVNVEDIQERQSKKTQTSVHIIKNIIFAER